jgi:NADPH-dependent 2,4-dienoyl-CoA reductase/sulfur reductase-like enzyme
VLLAGERHHPYLRPPLSKEYLLGKAGDDALPVVPEAWYADNGVEVRLGVPAIQLDPSARTVGLADGSRLEYAFLLLAPGRGHGASRCRAVTWTA